MRERPNNRTRLKSAEQLKRLRKVLFRHAGQAARVAEAIADFAEPAMQEFKSSRALAEFLAGGGFRVSWPWAGVPTAFRAVAGRGRPRIALLAEYDALPDCGARPGQWGHGCGHNLLGAGTALGGIAAAELLASLSREATVMVIGTPAEETLGGKPILAELGAFGDLDAVLTWHPRNVSRVNLAGGAAMDSVLFTFRGKTAHAAGSPHKGRSALDAALLTDVAVNYLREHLSDNVRIHSVITDGGTAPNVVPDRAEIWYYLRGRDRRQVDELRRRVALCARGAAMATETRCRLTVLDSVTERIVNQTLAEMLDAIMRRCGPPRFTAAEHRTAGKIIRGNRYSTTIDPIQRTPSSASSDEDNVSWFAPLGQFFMACVPEGTVGHHREYAAVIRTPGAHRGMCKAGEVLAAAVVELALNGPLLKRAKAEFKANLRGKRYDLPVRRTVQAALRRGRKKPSAP